MTRDRRALVPGRRARRRRPRRRRRSRPSACGGCSGWSGPYPRSRAPRGARRRHRNFFDAVGDFFDSLAEHPARWRWSLGLVLLRHLPDAARARVLQRAARRLPDERIAVPAHLGRVHRRLRLQQRRPGARRRRHQAVPRQDVGPERDVPGGRRRVLRRGGLRRRRWACSSSTFAFTPGRVPQAAGLRQTSTPSTCSFFAVAPALHAVPAHRARRSRCSSPSRCCRARVRAFWARVRQGLTILRDRRRYLREVFAVQFAGWLLPLHRVLVPARGVQRRRLGAQRPARARRQRGRGGRAVHAGRRGRAAGAAREGVRRHARRRRRSPPTPSASRSRSAR